MQLYIDFIKAFAESASHIFGERVLAAALHLLQPGCCLAAEYTGSHAQQVQALTLSPDASGHDTASLYGWLLAGFSGGVLHATTHPTR